VARTDRRALADEGSLLANEIRRASRTRTAPHTRDPSSPRAIRPARRAAA